MTKSLFMCMKYCTQLVNDISNFDTKHKYITNSIQKQMTDNYENFIQQTSEEFVYDLTDISSPSSEQKPTNRVGTNF